MELYIDGQKVGTKWLTDVKWSADTTDLYIGSFDGTREYMDGVIDEVRIYNRVLTKTEILQLMGRFPALPAILMPLLILP